MKIFSKKLAHIKISSTFAVPRDSRLEMTLDEINEEIRKARQERREWGGADGRGFVLGDGEHEALSGGPTCSDSCADGGDTGGLELIATIRKYRMVGNYSKNPNSSNWRRAAGCGTDIIERCEKAGLRTPEFYQDEDFRTILWRPVERGTNQEKDSVTDHVTGNVTGKEIGNVTGKVMKLILTIKGDTKTREEIMNILQLKGSGNFREGYLYPALSEGYVAKLYPDAVSRTDQAYYLTAKGLELLKKLSI